MVHLLIVKHHLLRVSKYLLRQVDSCLEYHGQCALEQQDGEWVRDWTQMGYSEFSHTLLGSVYL